MVDPLASSFARWCTVNRKGVKTITRSARTEGALDDYGNPTITWTTSTIYGRVHPATQDWVQKPEGVVLEEVCVVDIPTTTTMVPLDRVTFDSIQYTVGPIETRAACKRFRCRRIIQ